MINPDASAQDMLERPDNGPAAVGPPCAPDEPAEEPLAITSAMLAEEDAASPECDARVDFEKTMPPVPPLSILLIVINAVSFAWMLKTGALESEAAIVAAGALAHRNVFAGEYWRLLTAMFLHGSPLHLIGNCIVLYVLGMACEHAYGLMRTAGIYLFSGLTASLLSVAMSAGPSVGASGAIFGLAGTLIIFFRRYRKEFYLRDHRIGLVLLVWGIHQIGSGFLTPGIDNYAHIGGMLGGVITGLIVPPKILRRQNRLPENY